MLSRGLTCALRLRSRALSPSVASNRPLNASPEAQSVHQGLSILPSNTFTTSSVCGIFAAGGSLQQEGPSSQASSSKKAQSLAATPPKLVFLHDSRSIAAEQALVTRLANIWGMPPEVLASNVAMLSDLLKPCGRDTAAHALWVLVRCPALRHMTDQQVRHTIRGLHQRFPDIPKAEFKATVYKHPWVLNVQLLSPLTATAAKDAGSLAPEQQPQQKVLVTPWKQELALMLLEMQTPSGDSSSDSPTPDSCNSSAVVKSSSAAALAGVRMYLAAAEAQHMLVRGVAWAKAFTGTGAKASAATASPATAMKPAGSPSAAAGPIKPTPPSSTAADAADSLDCCTAPLQQPYTPNQVSKSQQEQQQQLQQLLYQCPRLTVLPPDLLASRWQLLLSVLLGQVESATAVARTNPYLMVTGYGYADKPQQGGCGGGGLSDWDYSQLAGLV